jgi:hypothetical protein
MPAFQILDPHVLQLLLLLLNPLRAVRLDARGAPNVP